MSAVIPIADARRKPTVRTGSKLHLVVDEAVGILAATDDRVFKRAGALVVVVVDDVPAIRQLSIAALRDRLTGVANFEKFDRRSKTWIPCLPPDPLLQAILARGEWPSIRPLVGILETPSLGPDGRVIQTPGYDEASGYMLLPSTGFSAVADSPTQQDARDAVTEILEPFCDFPFVDGPRGAHASAGLAFVLTLLARPAIEGCCPAFAIDASTRGTGKSKAVDTVCQIVTGRSAPKTPQPGDDEEMRKRITSIVIAGKPLAVIDNISRPLADPSLDAVLTTTEWEDRVLGRSELVSAPNVTIWAMTGNNLEFGGDTVRRVLPIRMETPLENPENRTDFVHPDLAGWVKRERPRLVVAALTVLRAFVVAGRPGNGCKTWGSFEAWSRLLPPALVFAGLPDPMQTRIELVSLADSTKSSIVALLEGWSALQAATNRGNRGLTVAEVLRLLYPPPKDGKPEPAFYSELRDAIEAVAPIRDGKPNPKSLGKTLGGSRRRIVGGRMFDQRPARAGVVAWVVVDGGEGGKGGMPLPVGSEDVNGSSSKRLAGNPPYPSDQPSNQVAE